MRTLVCTASAPPTGRIVIVLQHAQQFHLQPHRHVADFVQQQGAAVGGLEQAFLGARGAREGAAFVTEEFGLQQVLGHRAAIDGDERLVAARAGFVNGAGQQFLARAALAGQQHPRIGAGDHVGLRQLVFHQLIARDDVGAPILIDMREARHFERFLHVIEQVLLVHRLGEKAEGAALRRVHGIGNGAMRGENDDPQARPAALQLLEQADAVHLVHAQIRDHQVRPETHAGGQRGGGAFDRFDFVVLGAQADGQQAQQSGVIVDHQDARFALLRRLRVTRARLQAERQGGGGGNRIGVQCSLSG